MKTIAVAAALLASSALAIQLNPPVNAHDGVHARLHVSQSKMRREAGGRNYKRCKPHNKGPANPSPAPEVSPAPAPAPAPPADPAPAPEPPKSTPPPSGGGNGGGSGGVIKVKTNGCGDIGATEQTTKTSGPNGSQEWLICGLKQGGWKPPFIRVEDLKYKDLGAVMSSGNNIFKPCAPYTDMIYDAAGKYGLPPIMISSIMMQESTCNKDTVGGGGEQGLMQITKDKCGGAPGGNCKDPAFNIDTGARYLADQIKNNNGNVLLSIGAYNGWREGLTYGQATAAADSGCCLCQNNVDYTHQFLNGWMQAIDAYSTDLGVYKNLEVCRNK